VTKKPAKSQVRAQAVAERQRASEAAAKQRRNRTILWGALAVVVVIAIVVAVVASGGSDDSASATKWETAPVKVTGTPLPDFDAKESPDPALGESIPTVDGKSIYDGTPITIGPDSGAGEPQMIVFLAHWCPHCQREVPELVDLADEGVFDGVKVSAVATGTNEGADNYPPSHWLEDEEAWPFPVMGDSPTGTAAQAYGLTGYPYFVMVDADGTVAGRGSGELPKAQIRANIKALKAGTKLPISSSDESSSAN
jgi:cytochrome c biogenesis protein CcmG, thiol:disulfide interchange protein DsbE